MEKESDYKNWLGTLKKDLIRNKVLLSGVSLIALILFDYYLLQNQNDILNKYPSVEPVLLQFHNIIPEFIAVLLISLLTYWLLRGSQQVDSEQQIKQLAGVISSEVKSVFGRSNVFEKFGISDVHRKLDYGMLCNMISESKDRVWILHTWTRNAFHNAELREAYVMASKNKAKIKVLLLNPDTEIAKQRSYDSYGLDSTGQETRNRILNSLEGFQLLKDKNNLKNIAVKYYTALPSVPIYICDDKALAGYFMHEKISGDNLHIIVDILDSNGNKTMFGHQLENEFLSMWKNGENALA
jgi:hypothetical protein